MLNVHLVSLVVKIFTALIQLYGGNSLDIFGLRTKKDTTEITKDTKVYFIVFGTGLPRDGYFLSSTDRCEDWDSKYILTKEGISLKTNEVYKNAVRLEAPEGVPFSVKFSTFHLCHKSAISLNKVLLQVRDKGQNDLFLPVWVIVLICIATLVISSYCSGANFAYMRMSINDMALLSETGEEPHKTHARKIIKYRKQSNWLICTMALANILVNTIFTNGIAALVEPHKYGEILKYVVPTVFIVLLGEMLPQSVCNRFGLVLAAKTRHVTLILFVICAPIAWPLSKLIDFFLGREVREIYSEEKLKALIKVQAKKMEEAAQDILARIADFPKKTVEDMMTPMEDTFAVSGNDKLDVKLLVTILEKGFTRIPVHEEKNRLHLTSVLNVKDLATMTIDHKSTVNEFMSKIDDSRKQLRFVLAAQKGEAVMQEMMKGDHHLCAVMKFCYGRYRIVGLITFEDVLEEVFGDIEDDSDKMWNNRRAGVHKDQQTLDWFRSSEREQLNGLGVNATLRLIQSVFDRCPLLVTLGYDVLRMKGLLSEENLRHAEENEVITPRSNRKILIFFDGTITVENGQTLMYRMEPNRSDFRPYIWGKWLVKRIFKERLQLLSCLKKPPACKSQPRPPLITAVTRAAYFEISDLNIIEGLRNPDDVGYDNNVVLAKTPSNEMVKGDVKAVLQLSKEQFELDSTQMSSDNGRRKPHNTPRGSNDKLLHRSLTPERLRAVLKNLKSTADGSKELFSSDDSASDEKIAKRQLSPSFINTAREPMIRAVPPTMQLFNSLSKEKSEEGVQSRTLPSGNNDTTIKTDSATVGDRRRRSSKKSSEVVIVPSATNLVAQDKEPTKKKRSKSILALFSFLRRKTQ
ncbi:hypothetical protein V3C99_011513 [Haemonchus contortus]